MDKTQHAVAKELGICDSTLSRILTGDNPYPGSRVLCKLADYFGVSTDWLLGREVNRDAALHEAANALEGIQWNAYPLHDRKYGWYCAGDRLYVVHNKENGACHFVKADNPEQALWKASC